MKTTSVLALGSVVTGLALATSAVGPPAEPPPQHQVAAQTEAMPAVVALPPRRPARASRRAVRTTYVLRTVATGPSFSGQASWYGGSFQGRRTANGERFDTSDLTAASRTLPFGTKLRVCRRGECVVVRINDRGPYVGNRVLDLSKAAADRLGYSGVARVTATPVRQRRVAQTAPARLRPAKHAIRSARPSEPAAPSGTSVVGPAVVVGRDTDVPSAGLAGGLVLAGSAGLVRAHRRRTRF